MERHKGFRFRKIMWSYVLTDILLLAVSFFIILMWFPLSTQIPFQKYWVFALVFSGVWLLSSWACGRYRKVRFMRVWSRLLRLVLTAAIVFALMWGYMHLLAGAENYSIWVLLSIWIAMFVLSFVFTLIFHAYHYALSAEPEIERAPERGAQQVLKQAREYEVEQKRVIKETVIENSPKGTLQYLEANIPLYSTNTYIVRTAELFNVQKIKYFRFDCIVNLMPLNQIRGINKMFGMVNDKLPDDGLFVCCFEPQGVLKRRVYRKYPPVIRTIVYSCIFFYKRVIPKMFMTSRLYYDITEGKNRVLSKAEVLGRLCYCGFKIVDEHKRGDLVYVIAQRSFRPQTVKRRLYGMFINLDRVGKDGKMFKVHKFRTMHPYSEYLQAYIYEKYNLQAGGKFNHDIRVTTLGRFMRKCWIDELPMLINLVKGDMKLVGVRPISAHYFSLYSDELQKTRIRHKPGLLPPFYADMPTTLEEIEQSEMKYLKRCEQKGTFTTDFIYFWKIIWNIVFRRKRSN